MERVEEQVGRGIAKVTKVVKIMMMIIITAVMMMMMATKRRQD